MCVCVVDVCVRVHVCTTELVHLYMRVFVHVCVLYGREEGEGWRGRGVEGERAEV